MALDALKRPALCRVTMPDKAVWGQPLMCQYGNPVTTSTTETVVLCFSPFATRSRFRSFSKKRPPGRCAQCPHLCCFP